MFVTALYKVYMISGHSAAQEIKHIESLPVVFLDLKPSVLREVSAFPPGPQSCYGVRLNTAKESLVHQGHKKCTNDMNPSFYQLQV